MADHGEQHAVLGQTVLAQVRHHERRVRAPGGRIQSWMRDRREQPAGRDGGQALGEPGVVEEDPAGVPPGPLLVQQERRVQRGHRGRAQAGAGGAPGQSQRLRDAFGGQLRDQWAGRFEDVDHAQVGDFQALLVELESGADLDHQRGAGR